MVKTKYSELDGLITKKYGTRRAFSKEMGFSERTMSLKMNGVVAWNSDEMARACDLLGEDLSQIPNIFFAV